MQPTRTNDFTPSDEVLAVALELRGGRDSRKIPPKPLQ
jgi:hypothetical protein